MYRGKNIRGGSTMVMGIEGLEPSRLFKSTDFKSVTSANSAIFPTQTYIALKLFPMQDGYCIRF